MFRRGLLFLTLATGPFLAGCVVVWGSPDWKTCPEVTLPPTEDEVLAVKVEILRQKHPGPTKIPQEDEYFFEPVEPIDGQVPKNGKLTFSYLYWAALWNAEVSASKKHFYLTKLYRRGYQTIVIRPGSLNEPVVWVPALTPQDQELALAILIHGLKDLQPVRSAAGPFVEPPKRLAPGSTSEGHKRVLLFGADEYERLAGLYLAAVLNKAGTADELRCRLQAKKLRKRADEDEFATPEPVPTTPSRTNAPSNR